MTFTPSYLTGLRRTMSKGSLKTLVGLPLSFHEMSSPSASRLVLRTLNLAMPFAWTDFSHLGFSANVTSSERPSLICVFIAYYLHPSHSFSLHFALGAQSTQCPALCNSTYCSPPGSSVHVILQARILEWIAISSSTGSSWPRHWTWVSCPAALPCFGGFFTTVPPSSFIFVVVIMNIGSGLACFTIPSSTTM